MDEPYDLKTIVAHLTNGSLSESLCVVCLLPFPDENYENIFTSVCKKEEEYCVADVLKEVCQLKIQDTDKYNICINCFKSASIAYQFYLQAKRTFELLHFYTDQILNNIDLDTSKQDSNGKLCILLPIYTPETPGFQYGFDGIGQRNMGEDDSDIVDDDDSTKDEDVILIVQDEKAEDIKVEMEDENSDSEDENVLMIVNEKTRKKRDPMEYISCMHCPVRYRFLAKLKNHVKKVHNVDIFYCKICKLISDDKSSYEAHINTHAGEHQCTQCRAVFRRQESLAAHLRAHEEEEKQMENSGLCDMCEVCGVVLPPAALAAHAARHERAHTCYYCGRRYKVQASFEAHIRKHEALLNNRNKQRIKEEAESRGSSDAEKEPSNSTRSICGECGKSFVDERSLLWHQRLHDNDRPFVCDICGRGFVSLNRRNQHMTCAHSRPARRCPLCPALFHLTSMVNTHLKKVHLSKQQKRRNRTTKHCNVFWKTETVPIQELSVAIQNEVLEMQSAQDNDWNDLTKQSAETETPRLAKKTRKPPAPDATKPLFALTPFAIDPGDLPDDEIMHEQFDLDTHEFVDEEMV